MDTDVIIVGAGPVGLMLAGELCLAGVRPLVLERQPAARDIPRANGLGGQVLELLRHRGVLPRFSDAATDPSPKPVFPFGGVHVDLTRLAGSPLHALQIPQAQVESLLADRARELGADIRVGHELAGVAQDGAGVTVDVRGPSGPLRLTARYVVGCDGGRSKVRDLVGIPFPGTTYPEVNRFSQVTMPDSVTRLDNGDLDVPGAGRISAGFTRTDRGVFGLGWLDPEVALVFTTEDESSADGYSDDEPMTLAELRDSVRRVLGVDLPLGEPRRLSRFTFQARQVPRYRDGRILLAGDAAHLLPATGSSLNVGMLDAVNLAWKLAADLHGWAPPGLLDTYHDERHFAGGRALLQTQAQVALRRGHDPAADALRAVFQELLTDEQPARRVAALIAGADVRYPLPGADRHELTGAFAPDFVLDTVADAMRAGRPVLLDLADRQDLRDAAREWDHRVDVRTAQPAERPADAVLIRPDAHVAWAAPVGEPADSATRSLREAMSSWFGAAVEAPALG
jgi:2-polyprenyl-6-methoxyphenol hydroxylase-like FAD-dependent oxidoreductase